MASWLTSPNDPLYFQPDQQDFLESRRKRWCKKCKLEYQAVPPVRECPQCGAKGKRFFNYLTIIAGRRFGKSRIGSIAALDEACYPNSLVWACAPTVPKLHHYVIPAFQKIIPQDWVTSFKSDLLDLRLKNGSLIHFQTLEDPDQGRGQGLDALWIDEVCELSRKHWEVIRPSLAGDTAAFFTTTPRGFDWVYEELYNKAEQGEPGYWGVIAKSANSANPRLSEEFLAREKATMSDTMFRQEYEADFVNFTGSVYGNLITNQILHTDDEVRKVIPEWPKIDSWRQVIVGIDTGADHPFGGVKLVSTEKGMVAVGEYLQRDGSYIAHSAELKRLANNPNARYGLNKNERQGIIELAQHGIYCQKSENDNQAGIERVKSWLYHKQLFFVESRVPQTIRQMKTYRYDDNYNKDESKKLQEKVYKKDDELPDCIRYALMCWPELPKSAPDKEVKERDISHLSPEQQHTIMRLRRVDKEPKAPTESSTAEDFWA